MPRGAGQNQQRRGEAKPILNLLAFEGAASLPTYVVTGIEPPRTARRTRLRINGTL